jgi:hypothetical protein
LKTRSKIDAWRINTESIIKKSILLKIINKLEVFMVSIKVILIGLFGLSLCMANISGIVTDTGTTPIAGAVVQLKSATIERIING